MASRQLVITTVAFLSMFLNQVCSAGVCTEEDLTEAQRAFRNCVESSKAGIVSAHGNANNENNVCSGLEGMLGGCDFQVEQLARCTGRAHVDNLKAIHLSSIADVLKAINHKVNVENCSVFTEKTVISVTSSSNERDGAAYPEAEPVNGSRRQMALSYCLALLVPLAIVVVL